MIPQSHLQMYHAAAMSGLKSMMEPSYTTETKAPSTIPKKQHRRLKKRRQLSKRSR